jgi:hypothetical protein
LISEWSDDDKRSSETERELGNATTRRREKAETPLCNDTTGGFGAKETDETGDVASEHIDAKANVEEGTGSDGTGTGGRADATNERSDANADLNCNEQLREGMVVQLSASHSGHTKAAYPSLPGTQWKQAETCDEAPETELLLDRKCYKRWDKLDKKEENDNLNKDLRSNLWHRVG